MIWLRRVGWTVAAIALLMLTAWIALPWVVQSQGQKRLTTLLGRQVTIGKVDVRPWSLELTLNDFKIAAAAGNAASAPASSASASAMPDEPLLAVSKVYVNLQAASIWNRGVVVKALRIDQPRVRVARLADGRYDIDDIVARFAPKSAAEPSGDPARFALANIELKDGSVRFDDRPAGRIHELKSLDLALPFVSDLPADVAVTVRPHLSFMLNGAAFDSGAESTPFSADRASSMKLRIGQAGKGAADELDLAPYLGYFPGSLPVRIERGRVGADIEIRFATRADGTPRLSLLGDAHVSDLIVNDAAGAPLVGWKRLAVHLRDVQPLARSVSLGAVVLDGATLQVTRDALGRTNLEALAGPASNTEPATKVAVIPPAATATPTPAATAGVAASAGAASPASPAAASVAVAAAAPATPWSISIDSLALNGAGLQWRDATTRPAAALSIDDLTLQATGLQWPVQKPLPIKLSARIGVPGAPLASHATLTVDGPASNQEAMLAWKLDALHLDALSPYLAGVLAPTIGGTVDAKGRVDWAIGASPRMKLVLDSAQLSDFTLVPDAASVVAGAASAAAPRATGRTRDRGASSPGTDDGVAFKSLRVTGADVDLLKHDARIASVALQSPSARVERDAGGAWNVMRWSNGSSTPSTPTPPDAATAGRPASAAPWSVKLADFTLEGGRLAFVDAHPRPNAAASDSGTVRLDFSGLKVGAKAIDWSASAVTPRPPMHVTVAATLGRIAERQAVAGPVSLIDWRGDVALQPLAAKGTLRLQRIPVHVFAAYVDNPLRLELRRAYLGWRGDISLRQAATGFDIDAGGEARLGDVSVVAIDALPPAAAASAESSADSKSAVTSPPDELLRWQRLSLNAVKFQMRAASAPKIDIGGIEIADLYARLLITEQGRLNLQDVRAAPVDAPNSAAPRAAPRAARGASSVSPSPVVASASAASPASSPAASITVGGTTLVNGRIDFADHFVKPNYSAALTELNGSLGAFRSGSTEMATLELKGRAEGSALLDISGRMNPTAQPLALDIHAKATDLELAPLSPYAGKYAGYAIQRGKLSMDVEYKIDPDGRLEASNRVIINQLTFGDRIESPQATKLPVRLAIALLKDRNGVINLDLPVSGSLDDPQFSVVGLIGRVLFNLLLKAVTSPFSLLGGGGGGGGNGGLSQIEFRPGTAVLAEGQQAALDKVAQALIDRPSLNMTVTGESDPARETDAYRSALLEQKLINERRRELIRGGGAATPVPSGASAADSTPVTLGAADRERLVKQVYERSDLPDKPKNFIGLAKGVPTAEMTQRLKDAEPASIEALRELALQRGLAVRDALIAKGLKSDRLFLAAPKVGTGSDKVAQAVEGAASAASPVTPWVPRAELSLAAN